MHGKNSPGGLIQWKFATVFGEGNCTDRHDSLLYYFQFPRGNLAPELQSSDSFTTLAVFLIYIVEWHHYVQSRAQINLASALIPHTCTKTDNNYTVYGNPSRI